MDGAATEVSDTESGSTDGSTGNTTGEEAKERIGLARASTSYRFAVRFGAGVGVVGLIACILVDEWKIGVFLCVGLALGWLNSSMVVSATAKFAGNVDHDKRKFMVAVVRRLAIITLIAGYIMFAFQPDGLAVLFGLAFFQFTIIGSSAGVLYREVRQG